MEATASAVFNAATTTLLPQGLSPPPQVFVFDRLGGDRLVGRVTCRPYRRGQDAAVASAELGRIAAAVVGTDLLVFWEEFDLRTSVYGPSEQHPKALVILQATLQSHFLTWFPFESDVLSWRANGLPDDVRVALAAAASAAVAAGLLVRALRVVFAVEQQIVRSDSLCAKQRDAGGESVEVVGGFGPGGLAGGAFGVGQVGQADQPGFGGIGGECAECAFQQRHLGAGVGVPVQPWWMVGLELGGE